MGFMFIFWIFIMIFPSFSNGHVFLPVGNGEICSIYTEDRIRRCANLCITYATSSHDTFCYGIELRGTNGDCFYWMDSNLPEQSSFVLTKYFGSENKCPLKPFVTFEEAKKIIEGFDNVRHRYFDGSVFAFHMETMTWDNCKTKCTSMGGGFQMVSIHNGKENEFLRKLCAKYTTTLPEGGPVHACLLGIDIGTSGTDYKNVDQSLFDYNNFATGTTYRLLGAKAKSCIMRLREF